MELVRERCGCYGVFGYVEVCCKCNAIFGFVLTSFRFWVLQPIAVGENLPKSEEIVPIPLTGLTIKCFAYLFLPSGEEISRRKSLRGVNNARTSRPTFKVLKSVRHGLESYPGLFRMDDLLPRISQSVDWFVSHHQFSPPLCANFTPSRSSAESEPAAIVGSSHESSLRALNLVRLCCLVCCA